jgi:uncharacterized protein involved in exopolysaccharide biosynthesis
MNQDNHFILFSDIKEVFFRALKWIVLGAVIFGAAGFWVRSQLPVKHKICATFKDSEKSSGEVKGVFESLLKAIDVPATTKEGHVLLTSTAVLKPVIERFGFQAVVQEKSKLLEKWSRFKDAVQAEWEKPIHEEKGFTFSNVSYEGDLPRSYKIFFRSEELYEMRDREEHLIAVGTVGVPFVFDGICLTLESLSSTMKLRTSYPLTIHPLQEIHMELMKELEISSNKQNNGFLHITFTHSRRAFGKAFVDALMHSYQSYLERENQVLNDAQIAYLEERRDEYCHKMDRYLETHVDYMKKNLEEKGSFTLAQHLPLFQDRRLKFNSDLHALELKRKHLLDADPWTITSLGQEIATLQENLHFLSKEKDELHLSLAASPFGEKDVANYVKQLDNLKHEKLIAKTGINPFFPALLSPKIERERLLLGIPTKISPFIELTHLQEKKRKLEHFVQSTQGLTQKWYSEHLRLTMLQEEIVKKRLITGIASEKEYQGIDLKTARTLLLETIKKRDEEELRLCQMHFSYKTLDQEDVEYISLTTTFPDPISQGLVREMGELKQKLQSDRNYTERERERFEKRLQLRKEDLKRHIKQAISLVEIEQERLATRLMRIEKTIIDLLGQEIALIEKQIQDRMDEQLLYLEKEEELIRCELASIKSELENAPDLWLKEKKLQFSADLNQGMLESLVRLVESKNIENDISVLKAKAINPASASIKAKKPLLFIFGGIGGFLGAMVAFTLAFIHAIYYGFPLSLKNLRMQGKVTLGKVEGKEKMETLRHLTHMIEQKKVKVLSLIMKQGKDFSSSLATLLFHEGKTVLVIDLKLTKKIEQAGLIDYLENRAKEPSLLKKSYGDYIPMGEGGEYTAELLRNKRFSLLIERLKNSYDLILIALPVRGKTALPKTLFGVSDQMVIQLQGESLEDLTPYFHWEGKEKSLAFLQ